MKRHEDFKYPQTVDWTKNHTVMNLLALQSWRGKHSVPRWRLFFSGYQNIWKRVGEPHDGGNSNVSLPMLPSTYSMCREKISVKHKADGLYTKNWAKLEPYLEQLAHLNPSMTFVLEKDDDNWFLHYFIGFVTSIEILTRFGLGIQAIDAYHTKHHIFNGAVILLLVGCTIMNRNIPISVVLSMSETSNSYAFMANNLIQITGGVEFLLELVQVLLVLLSPIVLLILGMFLTRT